MRPNRFLAPWKNSGKKIAVYHVTSRVVDQTFHFGPKEKEGFRKFMRMYEKFSGNRVQAYAIMSNHFHILVEIPPPKEITDKSLIRRIEALYGRGAVTEIARELAEAREMSDDTRASRIHARFTYRMHDLSEFMKGLLIRFTRWFNRLHNRRGTLWEARFNSVIVESGTAARIMAAYIDLNPVRAGIVENPEDYHWSSYGEAIGGGSRGNGKKARQGLQRAIFSNREAHLVTGNWGEAHSEYRLLMELALERKPRKNADSSPAPGLAEMLRCRINYFTHGGVIGDKTFINEVFVTVRERFGLNRKDGARKLKGPASPAAEVLWSLRDLRQEE